MLQHSFLTRKDGDLLTLFKLAYVLSPKAPMQKQTCIPSFPGLSEAFYKALSCQALRTQEMTWHRGERFCSKWVSSVHRPPFSDKEVFGGSSAVSSSCCHWPGAAWLCCHDCSVGLCCELDRRADLVLYYII